MMLKRMAAVVVILLSVGPSLVPGKEPACPGELSDRLRLEKKVAALVRQLGDDDFQRREAAQQSLLRLGVDILPIVEKLGPQEDAEVRLRLSRIRRRLVGLLDDIRSALDALPEPGVDARPALPQGLQTLIVMGQPRSGDFLLTLLADPQGKLRRRAVNAFVHTWASMSAAQIDRYLQKMLVLEALHRRRYPQGVDAAIEMRYHCGSGAGSWPAENTFAFTTRTQHFLDGKPYGKPYRYQGPGACTGWLRTGDLSPGEHFCALEMDYEFTHQGKKCRGHLRSRDFRFTAVPAGAADDLAAPSDPALDRQVHKALHFAEQESEFDPEWGGMGGPCESVRPLRQPQITWAGAKGGGGGLATILWKVTEPLPVDLCFEVHLHDPATGKVYRCDPLVLARGQLGEGYFSPRQVVSFARGKKGDVAVKVVLTPSRKVALTSTQVQRYYSGSITSRVLKVRVFDGW